MDDDTTIADVAVRPEVVIADGAGLTQCELLAAFLNRWTKWLVQ